MGVKIKITKTLSQYFDVTEEQASFLYDADQLELFEFWDVNDTGPDEEHIRVHKARIEPRRDKQIDVHEYQGTFGEIVDNNGVTIVRGVDASVCGHCGAVITRGRLATSAEINDHLEMSDIHQPTYSGPD
jgi:hypothetical protein